MATFKAGAGAASIRFPQTLFPIEGFKGVHDNPHVRVLALSCGETVAIAAMELVNIPDKCLEYAKKIIAEKLGTSEDNVWVHATHAITTPHEPRPHWGEPTTPEIEQKSADFIELINKATETAATKAAKSFTDAVLGVGQGQCNVNVNRDVDTPFGRWIGINPDGISNKTAGVLRVQDKLGKDLGILINYDLKPCAIDNSQMEENERLVSSDVPGYACSQLELEYGCPVLFTMAAAGDQVPKEQAWVDTVDENGTVSKIDIGVTAGLEIVERLGDQMTAELGAIIGSIDCDIDDAPIKTAKTSIKWPGKARAKMEPRKTPNYEESGEYEIPAELITIGDTAFAAVKPEINTVTALELKKASSFSKTFVISMVNGGMKYMPDIKSFNEVSWEAQSSSFMPGVAEAWVKNTAEVLNSLK